MTQHDSTTYLPPAKYTRSGDGAQCCPHAKPVGPGSCEFCWELHEADCEPCWARRLARMTQPTDRPGINQITSDMLDQLYERLDKAERAVNLLADSHRRAERAEATLTAVRELHERDPEAVYCAVCSNHGDITWPCATIAVLDQHGQTPA